METEYHMAGTTGSSADWTVTESLPCSVHWTEYNQPASSGSKLTNLLQHLIGNKNQVKHFIFDTYQTYWKGWQLLMKWHDNYNTEFNKNLTVTLTELDVVL